jgi:hypothetical protein
MGTEAPQPRRLLLRVHAPVHLMSGKAAARLVLRHFADYHPKATLIFNRDDGVLTLGVIEVGINATVLRHADFGVCEVASKNASQGQRVTHYEGRHNRLDKRTICIAVDHRGASHTHS